MLSGWIQGGGQQRARLNSVTYPLKMNSTFPGRWYKGIKASWYTRVENMMI